MSAGLAWLASFRLRILFRSAFLLLALAVETMAVTFALPEGPEGGQSRTFLVPAAVHRPGGRPEHSIFLEMEGFQCSVPGCR